MESDIIYRPDALTPKQTDLPTHIGIDPGKTGAICFFWSKKDLSLFKMPETEHDIKNLIADETTNWFSVKRKLPEVNALIEQVNGMPKDGGSRAFNFGKSYGFIRGIITAAGIPLDEVHPTRWQKHFNLPTLKSCGGSKPAKKKLHKQKAQQLLPEIASDITAITADAALIALYSYERYKVIRLKKG